MRDLNSELSRMNAMILANTETLNLTRAILKVIIKRVEDQESSAKLNKLKESETQNIRLAALGAAIMTVIFYCGLVLLAKQSPP